jgi:Phosphoesterase family
MAYAKYIGRVGALAVALGVGMAVASTPGIAYALPSDSGSASSSTDGSSAPPGAASSGKSDSSDSSASDPKPPSGTAAAQPKSIAEKKDAADDDAAADAKEASGAEEGSVSDGDDEDAPPAVGDEDSVSGDSAIEPESSKPAGGRHARASTQSDVSADVKSSVAAAGVSTRSGGQVQTLTVDAVADVATRPSLVTPASAGLLAKVPAAVVAPAPPQTDLEDVLEEPHTFLVGMVAHLVNAVVTPLLGLVGPGSPAQSPLLWTLLAFARNEFGRFFLPNLAHDPATPTLVLGPNLLVNPGAELGDPSLSGYAAVTVPGWMVTGTPTVIKYGTQRRFPVPTSTPGPVLPGLLAFPSSDGLIPAAAGGQQFFGGGPVADSTLTQTVDLRPAQGSIDAGNGRFTLSGDLGGFFIDPSRTLVTVNFLDANGVGLGTANLKPVTAWDRLFATGFIHRDASGAIPTLTRSAQVVVTLDDRNPVLGNYNNAYADNLSFTVNDPGLTPATLAPPESNVGDLDHVFMVYLENKGVSEIVGSPNAPYINSLINNYGYASNYYGLTHPSDPNYYPIVGGSDFGFNYNCPARCFPADTPNLADRIEAARLNWAGYMEGGGGYTTPNDRLPFLAFSDIYDDPDRIAKHLFDISELEQDLADPVTAPNFVWLAADDATNMEGPTDFPLGILNWALGFLNPAHQYNVKAGDEWLQGTLTTIMNSPTWQDPTQKSAIFVTFDEDYNNITTGVGNEGNHIVMIVIPSQGAVDGGMREGHFVADDNNNHYSLLRTIEDSLGLLPLTNNDQFAQPMNEFWEAQDPQSSGQLIS